MSSDEETNRLSAAWMEKCLEGGKLCLATGFVSVLLRVFTGKENINPKVPWASLLLKTSFYLNINPGFSLLNVILRVISSYCLSCYFLLKVYYDLYVVRLIIWISKKFSWKFPQSMNCSFVDLNSEEKYIFTFI